MKRKIELTDKQRDELIQFYEAELKRIEERKQEIFNLLRKLKDESLSLFDGNGKSKSPKSFTWKAFIFETLKEKNEFLITDDFYQELIFKYPKYEKESRRSLISSISGSLSQNASKGKIERIELDIGNLWGLPEWFNNNGSVKDEYAEKIENRGFEIP